MLRVCHSEERERRRIPEVLDSKNAGILRFAQNDSVQVFFINLSEVQPHIELDQAGAITVFPGNNVGRPSDRAKPATIGDTTAAAAGLACRDAAATAARIRKGRSVGDVQGLGTQLEIEALCELEGPKERRVHVEIVRPVKLIEGHGAIALRVNP